MTIKVYINLNPDNAPDNNGIGRIVQAQHKLLPDLGIKLVKDPGKADVVACHIHNARLDRVDVLHLHGLYFSDLPHSVYAKWHYRVNSEIIESARRAKLITTPSEWVARPFKRDMHIQPAIIPHGIDFNAWNALGERKDYILWNKGRADDVCDPTPLMELARAGLPVVSTFSKPGEEIPASLHVVGVQPFDQMKLLIESASVYLATTPETFGIGTIEAMAAGVPILGYRWGGTADIVEQEETGWLVEPGDIKGLIEGYWWIKANFETISANAREAAKKYDWNLIMPQYAALYKKAAEIPDEKGVSVVIPSYNYAKYLPECIDSVLAEKPDEVIVIDDGSKDNTPEVIVPYLDRVRYIRQENAGVAASRNNGIAAANYDFILCLDADDKVAPGMIKHCVDALKKDRGLGVAYTGLAMIHGDGRITESNWPGEFNWNIQAGGGNPPGNCIPSGAMFRKRMWTKAGGYYQEFAPGEDAEFWTRGLGRGFTAKKVTNECLFQYRVHEGSASRTKKYREVDTWLPWVKDKKPPIGAPIKDDNRPVLSYMNSWIDIVIPVGPGHEQHLLQAIRSIEGQTWREWRLYIVDDTKDGLPANILESASYASERIIRGRRQGAGAARNDGVGYCSSPFVLFLDADDWLAPDALEQMLSVYKGDAYIYTDWWAVKDGKATAMSLKAFENDTYAMQHAVTVLMPLYWARQLRFDESLPAWEDWDWFIQARTRGFCGRHLPIPLLYYQLDSGSRRNAAEPLKEKINSYLRSKYEGVNLMACGSCPSPAAGPIMDAKRAMGLADPADAPLPAGVTRLEFIGSGSGVRTYTVNNHAYRAGNSEFYRYVNVQQEDAEKLLAMGIFRVVRREAAQVPASSFGIAPAAPAIAAPTQAIRQPAATMPKTAQKQDVVASPQQMQLQTSAVAEVAMVGDLEAVSANQGEMPATIKGLSEALKTAKLDTIINWELSERNRGDKARKPFLNMLRKAMDTAEPS